MARADDDAAERRLDDDAASTCASPAPSRSLPPSLAAAPARLVSAYLPLLLMAVLALGTWWLVQNTPEPSSGAARAAAPRHEPDYTMTQFACSASTPTARCEAQIEGDALRHFPDTTRSRSTSARIRAIGDRRPRDASPPRAARSRTATAARCSCSATPHVVREPRTAGAADRVPRRVPARLPNAERVRSHLPVLVTQGGSEFDADGHGVRQPGAASLDAARAACSGDAACRQRAKRRRAMSRGVTRRWSSSPARRAASARRWRALRRARAAGWRWSRGAPTRCAPGPRRRAATPSACAVYVADVRDVAAITARRPRLHRARRACPTS